ncbi:MAG TPA: hypothetical protein VIC26_02620 [Marinagarivorans sp.]
MIATTSGQSIAAGALEELDIALELTGIGIELLLDSLELDIGASELATLLEAGATLKLDDDSVGVDSETQPANSKALSAILVLVRPSIMSD